MAITLSLVEILVGAYTDVLKVTCPDSMGKEHKNSAEDLPRPSSQVSLHVADILYNKTVIISIVLT